MAGEEEAAEGTDGAEGPHQPYIPAETTLPETTLKAILLGAGLAILLGAANAYVGLRVGLTVSASIPAAVISMGIFRLFRTKNILENNIVQTAASAGEALAAGVIFTIPALLILEFAGQVVWTEVRFLEVLVIAGLGGILGVLFTVPLRRALIVQEPLPFPEGIAAAEVLESGEEGGQGVRILGLAVVVGGLYALFQTGLSLWEGAVQGARRVGDGIAYFGSNITPILLGVGYIVGARIGALVFLGGAIAWLVLIPVFGVVYGYPAGVTDPVDAAFTIWDQRIRLVGGGAMITGGAWTLWKVRGSLGAAFNEARRAFARGREERGNGTEGAGEDPRPRTEQDLPLDRVFIVIGLLVVPLFGVYWSFTGNIVQAAVAAVVMLVAGFFFSAVAAYMAGVVGSSNNPISGVTIVTLLFASLLLVALNAAGAAGAAAALGVAAVIASAGAIAGDNLQDLKTGWLLGATPKRQQMAQIVGVVSFATVAPIVLIVIHEAFTIGSRTLPAPQAFLMSAVLQGVFGGTLDWAMIALGMAIAGGIIVLDEVAQRVSTLRFHVMAVAVGLYLPLELGVPIFAGGLLRALVDRVVRRRDPGEAAESRVRQHGVLFGSGLIAGEAIMGIMVAALIMLGTLPSLGLGANPLLVDVPALLPDGVPEALFVQQVVVFRFAPLVAGALLAGGLYVLGDGLPSVVRKGGSLLLFAGGAAASFLFIAGGAAFAAPVSPGFVALPLFAFVALLMVYVPLRGVLVGGDGGADEGNDGDDGDGG